MQALLTLAFILLSTSIPTHVQAARISHLGRKSISLIPQQEYTLSNEYDLSNPQSLFHITSFDNSLSPNPEFQSHQQPLPNPPSETATENQFTIRTKPTTILRPVSSDAYQAARLRSLFKGESEVVEWEEVEILAPDVEDKHTISQLARMTGNAYALPGKKNWYDIEEGWNNSFPFGWEDPANGFRGHVFLSPDNSTVVLSIKGTTLQGPTSKKDKFNDNLLFSCCCARVDLSWVFNTVCDCYAKNWRCDTKCLNEALVEDSLFYSIGVNLITNLTDLYPDAQIWLTGHSLGGGLASLLGTTFGHPAIAFEAPGERLAAERLHLPLPPSTPFVPSYAQVPITHIYHNADPIPQGACTGMGSPCTSAGFALENRCHLGKTIVYDTVGKLGWKVDVRKHVIREVILNVIEAEVEGGWEFDVDVGEGLEVPKARVEEDCVDCFKWEFGDFKHKDLL